MNKAVIKGKNYEGVVEFKGKNDPDMLSISNKKNINPLFYSEFYSNNFLQKVRQYQASIILKKIPQILTASSILEVGCGDGTFVDELAKIYKGKVVGIDPFLKKETANKKKYGLFDFKGKTFDCVILLDVFEHFEDNSLALDKLNSHIKPGGYLVLKVPNKNALFYKIAKAFSVFNTSLLGRLYQIDFPPQHFFYYNEKSLKSLCDRGGFKSLNCFYMSEVPLEGLYNRLWGISPFLKIFILPFVVMYNLFLWGSLRDSLVICFKKQKRVSPKNSLP